MSHNWYQASKRMLEKLCQDNQISGKSMTLRRCQSFRIFPRRHVLSWVFWRIWATTKRKASNNFIWIAVYLPEGGLHSMSCTSSDFIHPTQCICCEPNAEEQLPFTEHEVYRLSRTRVYGHHMNVVGRYKLIQENICHMTRGRQPDATFVH